MSHQPINIHRSFAGLLVGNIVAIFVSGLACILIWQSVFPDFYQQLRQHIRDVKNANISETEQDESAQKKTEPKKKDDDSKPNQERDPKLDRVAEKPVGDGNEKEPDEEKMKITPMPDFSLGIWATTLFIDVFFAALSGFLCVWIAGFARNNHAILMALLIMVWKFQQLVGFVDNQIPPSLILAEVIGLPIACMVGATMVSPGEDRSESSESTGDDQPHDDSADRMSD